MPSVSVWFTEDNLRDIYNYMNRRGTKNFSKSVVEMLYPLDNDTLKIVTQFIQYQEGLTGRPINFQVGINLLIRRYEFLKDENYRLKRDLEHLRTTSSSSSTSSKRTNENPILDATETLTQTKKK